MTDLRIRAEKIYDRLAEHFHKTKHDDHFKSLLIDSIELDFIKVQYDIWKREASEE